MITSTAFSQEKITEGLDPELLFIHLVNRYDLDARPVYRRGSWDPQTTIGFRISGKNSSSDCWKQTIYSGNDNRYFLERNIQPLRDWVCVADWLALEGLFGPCYCFFCDIKEDSRWEQTDPNKKRWTMKNPDEVLPGALLHVRQRNIRICGLHSGKRLFSILCDCLILFPSNKSRMKLIPSLRRGRQSNK